MLLYFKISYRMKQHEKFYPALVVPSPATVTLLSNNGFPNEQFNYIFF